MHIKYILTHPIQYQSPLIKYLVKRGLKIKVLYRSNISVKTYFDPGFGKKIKWDTSLLRGYNFDFLNFIGPNKVGNIFPITTEFINKIFNDKTNIIWLHGIKNWYNLCIIILSKFFKKKVFVRDEMHQFSKNRTTINNFLNYLFFQLIDQFIDVYLAIGTANKKYYIKNNIGKKKIITVPYTVNNEFFNKKRKKISKNKKTIFMFAAKLIPRKGADLLLESLILLKKYRNFSLNTEFLIIGDGEMKKQLIQLSKENNLKNVTFFPFQNQKNLSKFYQNSDVFIMPSRIEPWGLTVNEAMSAENAIISSNQVGSAYDLVKKNINGFTFINNDSKDLARKILLIYKNKGKIKKFKSNSLKIISRWGFKQCYKGLQEAIHRVQV